MLHKAYPEINLVCTGAPFKANEIRQIEECRLTGCVVHSFVTDAQLAYLYSHALCFVYPSLYEGFGIPILEAFATDCPVLLSDASCFPEIAQGGGLYFNPTEIDDMADAMKRVIEDSSLRNNLIANGRERLKSFSWKKMAEQTGATSKSITIGIIAIGIYVRCLD